MELPDLEPTIINDISKFESRFEKLFKLSNKFLWDKDAEMITSFRGEYGFLSNFSDHRVAIRPNFKGRFDPLVFQTSEHAFQAFKTDDPEIFNKIAYAPTASESKQLAKSCPIREDWDIFRNYVMFNVLLSKFSIDCNPDLVDKLVNTYPKYLMEGNTWGDQYWGCTYSETFGEWIGENRLGHMLMLIRYQRMSEWYWTRLLHGQLTRNEREQK